MNQRQSAGVRSVGNYRGNYQPDQHRSAIISRSLGENCAKNNETLNNSRVNHSLEFVEN